MKLRLPHLLNLHKIKIKIEEDNKIRHKGLFSLRHKERGWLNLNLETTSSEAAIRRAADKRKDFLVINSS